MKSKKLIPEAFKCCFAILSILLLAFQYSCVSPGQMTVAPERTIPLFESTPYEGSWESSDVALEYQYVKQADVIQLSVTGKAKRGYDQLNVWVLFVDKDGKVLEERSVYYSGFRSGTSKQWLHKGKFEKTFEMPLATTHIAFKSSSQLRIGR